MQDRIEIADNQKGFLLLFRLSQEYNDAFLRIRTVYPLKSLWFVVHLVKRRIVYIKFIQGLHILLHLLMEGLFHNSPIQLCILIPLMDLCKFLPHKQQFLARMPHHKTVCGAQVRRLYLQLLSRHLADHGAFSMDHFIVREYQNEIFAVCIKHAEGQFTVMVLSEIRITLHISRKIIHPAHIPFIIEAKGAFLDIACNLRPCGRFLGNQDGSVRSRLKHGI